MWRGPAVGSGFGFPVITRACASALPRSTDLAASASTSSFRTERARPSLGGEGRRTMNRRDMIKAGLGSAAVAFAGPATFAQGQGAASLPARDEVRVAFLLGEGT